VEIPFLQSAFGWAGLCRSLLGSRGGLQRVWDSFARDTGLSTDFVFTSSCRAALVLAYRALCLDGEVIVSPLTCSAALQPILAAGLRPKFADVCLDSFNLDPEAAQRSIGPRTVAIEAIYLGGNASGAAALAELARKHGLKLVEDCTHGAGARDGGCPTGTFGDAACLSFPKIVDGAGGALCGRNATWLNDARNLQSSWNTTSRLRIGLRLLRTLLTASGINLSEENVPESLLRFARRRPESPNGSTTQVNIGKCARTRSVESAWAACQLGKWRRLASGRQTAALHLKRALARHTPNVRIQLSVGGAESTYTRFYVRVPARSDDMIGLMRKHGVEVIHLSHGDGACQLRLDHDPCFSPYLDPKELPNYFQLHDHLIALPLHAAMGPTEAEKIALALKLSLAAAAGEK